MPAPEPLFCFTSNKIDSSFCPICRAPLLVRVGLDLSARTFECFNCDKVVVHRLIGRNSLIESRSWDARSTYSASEIKCETSAGICSMARPQEQSASANSLNPERRPQNILNAPFR